MIIAPRFGYAVRKYEATQENDGGSQHVGPVLLKVIRVLLLLIPIALIVLIVVGYYYTALKSHYTLYCQLSGHCFVGINQTDYRSHIGSIGKTFGV